MLNQSYKPKKKLGQNFLRSEAVIKLLVESAKIEPEEVILEPGAGMGVVTKKLAEKAKLVWAIELDNELISKLEQTVPSNVKVINQDVLKLDWESLNPKPTIIVGAIPYQITSPLIHKIFYFIANHPGIIKRVVLLIQKEVAQKLTATAPHASYLSNITSLFGTAKIVRTIPPGAFYPAPKVNSAIWSLEIKDKTPDEKELREWETLLHKGFAHPRQMINKVFDAALLKSVDINPQARAENLEKKDWEILFSRIQDSRCL